MPEIVAEMPASTGKAGRPPKYDWPAIFDGAVHRFPPEDLPSTPRNFGRLVRKTAAQHGVDVKIITRATQGVYVQRIIPDND